MLVRHLNQKWTWLLELHVRSAGCLYFCTFGDANTIGRYFNSLLKTGLKERFPTTEPLSLPALAWPGAADAESPLSSKCPSAPGRPSQSPAAPSLVPAAPTACSTGTPNSSTSRKRHINVPHLVIDIICKRRQLLCICDATTQGRNTPKPGKKMVHQVYIVFIKRNKPASPT